MSFILLLLLQMFPFSSILLLYYICIIYLYCYITLDCRCQNGVTGVMLVTAAQNSPNMFIFIISNYWKSFGTDICQKRTMSHVNTLLSHYSGCGGTRPKNGTCDIWKEPKICMDTIQVMRKRFWPFLEVFGPFLRKSPAGVKMMSRVSCWWQPLKTRQICSFL